jgi:hypothetical protein
MLQDFDFINYQQVPTAEAEDCNRDITRWVGGRCVSLNEGTHTTLYIGHHVVTEQEQQEPDGDPVEVQRTYAMPIRVANPVTRDAAINAAEMTAYSLRDAMAVAAFAASMARKFRDDSTDPEVLTHDAFIAAVKQELTEIGV